TAAKAGGNGENKPHPKIMGVPYLLENRWATIAGVLLISVSIASSEDLKTYKATYEKRMEQIILTHGMKMIDLSQQYTKALDALLIKVKHTGDLDKTTAVMEEIARFRKEKSVPEKPSTLSGIQKLQSSFTKQASTHETSKAKSIITLAQKYDHALERLQRTLVSSSRLDDAKAVQEERKHVQEEEAVAAAKSWLSSHRAAKTLAGAARTPTALRAADTYTLTVVTKTGLGKYDPSDGSDRVRMYVCLGDDDAHKKELKCGGFGRGSEIAFEGIECDYPLDKVTRISLLCTGGSDAWGMDGVSFQFFKGHKASKQYLFKERTSFSGQGSDSASTLKSFQIPGGVKINRVALKSSGLK
ncbi:MAG: hypothetical protein HN919_22075, partial [Verrucomicrobia bacterium]|nr:hypothetical protein [Verrucomicrobiota bacterium]